MERKEKEQVCTLSKSLNKRACAEIYYQNYIEWDEFGPSVNNIRHTLTLPNPASFPPSLHLPSH